MLFYAIAVTFALGMLVGVQVTFFGAYLKDKRDEKASLDAYDMTKTSFDEPPFNLINPDSIK